MSENLMNTAHKATNKAYREGWDRIFGGESVDKQSTGTTGNEPNSRNGCPHITNLEDAVKRHRKSNDPAPAGKRYLDCNEPTCDGCTFWDECK